MEELLTDKVVRLADEAGFRIGAKASIPRRSAALVPVPAVIHEDVRMVLASDFPKGLYAHQAEAIRAVSEGSDICIATATASGKSHVFIAAGADLLKREPSSKVVAFYPARALIQDQIQKWKTFVERLGLSVGYIDGGIPMAERMGILQRSHVVLLTPDVAHAWLMNHLGEPQIRDFMHRIRLVILDEAHVYEGVFGTNMAYFIRRFQVAAGSHQLICSTATVGDPVRFIRDLTGRGVRVWIAEDDRSDIPAKCIMVARPAQQRLFDGTVHLLTKMAEKGLGRFLAFSVRGGQWSRW